MNKVKYGKIKKSNVSNIFATTVQLIIRMKQLIEGQFKNFLRNPDSEVIPAIIDIYEQMINKQEYLVIDPFIHAMKNEFSFDNYDEKFVIFFSSVICSIDFSASSGYKQICLTTLKDKTNRKDNENYIFDISFEKNKKLSAIIQDQYEFSDKVIFEPSFLFFSPVNNNQLNISSIDDKISLKNNKYPSSKFNYYLSIIVAKNIQPEYFNHFILYVGAGGWIQIEDDEIFPISKKDIFEEIINTSKYQIELFGYCRDPGESIVTIDTSCPKKIEYYDFDNLKQIQPKPPPTNYPISNQEKEFLGISQKLNVIYTVTFVQFDHYTSLYKIINEKKLKSSNERNKYLNELEKESKNKHTQLFFDNGTDCSATNCFDAEDVDISVYSIDECYAKIWLEQIGPPYVVYFREYFNNDDGDDVFDEDELPTKKFYFDPKTTTEQLLTFGKKNLPGNPETFYLKNTKTSARGVKIYCDLLLTSSWLTKISSIFKKSSSVIVYYKSNKSIQADSRSYYSTITTKPSAEPKSPVVYTKYYQDSKLSTTKKSTTEPKQSSSSSTKSTTESKQSSSTKSTTESKQSSSSKSTTESKQSATTTKSTTEPVSPVSPVAIGSKPSNSSSSPTTESKLSYSQDTQTTNSFQSKTPTFITIEKSDNDDIIITRPLRKYLYCVQDNRLSCVKKLIIKNKSEYQGYLKDLIPYLLKSLDSQVVSYYIIYNGQNFIVRYLDPETFLIRNLPSYFNFQIRPSISAQYRVCVLYRSPTFNSHVNLNKDCFSFAILFSKEPTYEKVIDCIKRFLFKGENEKELINDQSYEPALYIISNNIFVKLKDIKKIAKDITIPIFVIWKSPKIYDFVITLINKYTLEEIQSNA